jgi:hypothetical protein
LTWNIQTWIDHLVEESQSIVRLEVVPTPKGWAAKIINEGHLLLDYDGENFMITEDSTIDNAIKKLDRRCATDLAKIFA